MTPTTRRLTLFAACALLLLALPAVAQDAEASAENPMWDRISERMDADGDGTITADEFKANNDRFNRADRNQDGVLTAEDFVGIDARHQRAGRGPAVRLMRLADSNGDGLLTRAEWTGYLEVLDSNTDGTITRAEIETNRPDDFPVNPNRPAREFNISVERLNQAFDKFDRNADGNVSEDELPRRRGPRT